MGTFHTYGVLGLSALMLALAMLGSGWYHLGGLVIGVAPAVHPSLGLWLWVIVAVADAWDCKALRPACRLALPYVAAGCGIAALSFAAWALKARDVGSAYAPTAVRYVPALVAGGWDEHRSPVDISSVGVILNALILVISGAWLTRFRDDLSQDATFALRALAASAGLSLC